MRRIPVVLLCTVLCGLTSTAEATQEGGGPGGGSGPSEAIVAASALRRTIVVLDDMTPMERQQIVPWLVQRISQQSDVYVNSQLSELLEERLIQLGDLSSERIEALEASALSEEEIGLTGEEREHFNALVRREQASPLPEDDIRQEILGMTLDRDQPELTLNRAMELGTMIERIPDESVRLALRRTLEDKLVELQPH